MIITGTKCKYWIEQKGLFVLKMIVFNDDNGFYMLWLKLKPWDFSALLLFVIFNRKHTAWIHNPKSRHHFNNILGCSNLVLSGLALEVIWFGILSDFQYSKILSTSSVRFLNSFWLLILLVLEMLVSTSIFIFTIKNHLSLSNCHNITNLYRISVVILQPSRYPIKVEN